MDLDGIAVLRGQLGAPRMSPSMRSRRRTLIFMGAVTLLATIGAPVAAAPPPDMAAWVAEVQGSGTEGGTPLADAAVEDATGRSLAHTPVQLMAWPSDSIMSRLALGDTVRLTPVARGVTDASGRVRLAAPNGVDWTAVTGSETDDVLDFELQAWTASGPAVHTFSRRLIGDPGRPVFVDPQTGDDQVVNLHVGTPAVDDISAVETAVDNAPVDKGCSGTVVATYSLRSGLVGSLYSPNGGAALDYVYSSGASSDVGVGFSVSGAAGSWSASGTTTQLASSSINYAALTTSGSQHLYTQFQPKKIRMDCYAYSGAPLDRSYRLHSYWAGGSSRASTTAPSATYCVNHAKGDAFVKSSSTATTFSNGLKTSGIIGIDLSMRTGYTSAAKSTFTFTAARRLCGTSGFPVNSPGRLVVKS